METNTWLQVFRSTAQIQAYSKIAIFPFSVTWGYKTKTNEYHYWVWAIFKPELDVMKWPRGDAHDHGAKQERSTQADGL